MSKNQNSSDAIGKRKEKTETRLAKQTQAEHLAYIRESIKPVNGHTWILDPVQKYIHKLLAAGSVVPAPPVTPPPQSAGSPSSSTTPTPALADGDGSQGGAEAAEAAAADDPAAKKAEADAAMAKKVIVHQYPILIKLPVEDLKWLLTSIEPFICSGPALRALCTRGARDASKTSLCEVLEFATGVAGTDKIHQIWETMGALSEYMKSENLKRSRPLSWRALSSEWLCDGVYNIELAEEGLYIQNRIADMQVCVPLAVLQQYKLVAPFKNLFVEKNFSEKDATVLQKGSPGKLPLMAVMGLLSSPLAVAAVPRPAKRPRMLEDVVPSTQPEQQQQQQLAAMPSETDLAEAAAAALEEEQKEEEGQKQEQQVPLAIPSPPDSDAEDK
mmetsp:Transcript_50998/g.121150  ORF Transcript_50998/g.121150 Transcript_50998/m.121150 type:complete len:386 (+) Transcript_50998:74-1231(+)|eukprot:CAMPEP_0178403106 /NCGR_PEP_ID=MMETSP0689_2-20121128/17196_1 /TAXON_ID=160604 /ORGANISM="Amphidinium massartii, Strain CS-259" /LENGTH=385 /DNA_ID=CAMNT_0020024047 /DNA_START=60 /DNA_END=1217 /DNA_ORIENTATION=+